MSEGIRGTDIVYAKQRIGNRMLSKFDNGTLIENISNNLVKELGVEARNGGRVTIEQEKLPSTDEIEVCATTVVISRERASEINSYINYLERLLHRNGVEINGNWQT